MALGSNYSYLGIRDRMQAFFGLWVLHHAQSSDTPLSLPFIHLPRTGSVLHSPIGRLVSAGLFHLLLTAASSSPVSEGKLFSSGLRYLLCSHVSLGAGAVTNISKQSAARASLYFFHVT